MGKTRTREEAYLDAGFDITSSRNRWSVCDSQANRVAITVLDDQIDKTDEPWSFHTSSAHEAKLWQHKQGNRTRIKHVTYALTHCGGLFAPIWILSADTTALTRKIIDCQYLHEREGRILPASFNPQTGEFAAELYLRNQRL